MKKHSKTLPKRVRERIDFEYIKGLGEQEQRAATFYEYGRHCVPLKEFVEELRQAGAFTKDRVEPLSLELSSKLNAKLHVWKNYQLYGLGVSDDFPDKPFKDNKTARGLFDSESNYYGIEKVGRFPWPALLEAHVKNRNMEQALADLRACSGTSTVHAIFIPWKYTNGELAKMFYDLLPDLRPDDFPEPKKAGRRGRSEKLGIWAMLKQLAAFRLDAAAFDYSAIGSPYGSKKGFNEAVKIATERINRMMEQPFFS